MTSASDTYEVVAVVIAFLLPHTYLHFIEPCIPRCLQEVLREELSILVEVVPRALYTNAQSAIRQQLSTN